MEVLNLVDGFTEELSLTEELAFALELDLTTVLVLLEGIGLTELLVLMELLGLTEELLMCFVVVEEALEEAFDEEWAAEVTEAWEDDGGTNLLVTEDLTTEDEDEDEDAARVVELALSELVAEEDFANVVEDLTDDDTGLVDVLSFAELVEVVELLELLCFQLLSATRDKRLPAPQVWVLLPVQVMLQSESAVRSLLAGRTLPQ